MNQQAGRKTMVPTQAKHQKEKKRMKKEDNLRDL